LANMSLINNSKVSMSRGEAENDKKYTVSLHF